MKYGEIGEYLKMCRQRAGFKTQAQAYQATYISESSLSAYERNDRIPSPDHLRIMAQKYKAPELIDLYCKFCCGTGYYFKSAPDLDLIQNKSKIVLRLFNTIREVEQQLPKVGKSVAVDDCDVNPQVTVEMKLMFKELERLINAFNIATEDECPNKEIVKLDDKRKKVRV